MLSQLIQYFITILHRKLHEKYASHLISSFLDAASKPCHFADLQLFVQALCKCFQAKYDVLAMKAERALPSTKPPDFTPKAAKLLREVETMKSIDISRIEIIIEGMEKIQDIDPTGVSEVAKALKAKISHRKDLMKKYGPRIDYCIIQ